MAETIRVEVVYALPGRQQLVALEVPSGTTVEQAINQSGLREQFPGLVVNSNAIGIFSRKVPADTVLGNGDRVEIYRPLVADPKEVRRQRATKNK